LLVADTALDRFKTTHQYHTSKPLEGTPLAWYRSRISFVFIDLKEGATTTN
jgi:hypothetical protein